MNIEENIAARERAIELFDTFIAEESPRFCETLYSLLIERGKVLPQPEKALPPMRMNMLEVVAFQKRQMPFGAFKGFDVGDLELGYLEALLNLQESEFNYNLVRYVNYMRSAR